MRLTHQYYVCYISAGSNAPTFDCCFHPDTLRMAQTNAQFRQLTVQVAIDSIIHAFDKMQQKVTVDEGESLEGGGRQVAPANLHGHVSSRRESDV